MRIAFHRPPIGEAEIAAVTAALRSGWLTMGPRTVEFEARFCEYIYGNGKGGRAVAVGSATAALHLALKAVGLGPGDEVIFPTNTFVSAAEVVACLGARPVPCDIEELTHNIDVSKIEPLISDRTKALIPVHFGGQPCDMAEIKAIARKHRLLVIEDAAHALPALYRGEKVGTLGDITCFSFHATKTLCTGEGGMAVTRDEGYARRIRQNRLHGIDRDAWDRHTRDGNWFYDVTDYGCKYNMTDMNAALGLVQLARLEEMWRARRVIAERYDDAFRDSAVRPLVLKDDRVSSYHLYVIRVNNRDEMVKRLKENSIGASVHFIPVHKFSCYRQKYAWRDGDYPVANAVFAQSLSLPIYPGLAGRQVDQVARVVLDHAQY